MNPPARHSSRCAALPGPLHRCTAAPPAPQHHLLPAPPQACAGSGLAPSVGLGDEDPRLVLLGAALASNKTLGALSLWGNERISAAAAAQLRAAWQRNGLLSLDDD